MTENNIMIVILILLPPLLYLLYLSAKNKKNQQQQKYIETYQFPSRVTQKVLEKYPHLTPPQLQQVLNGLRDYFLFCQQAPNYMIAMPSQVVDLAWHEFILFTKQYEHFSQKAMGRFLHHTPTEAMITPRLARDGLKRVWRLACAKEAIDPTYPKKLPLLFALDKDLAIKDGFTYYLNCKDENPNGYCAGSIGCASGCGGSSGNVLDTAPSGDSISTGDSSGGSDGGGSSCSSGCGGN